MHHSAKQSLLIFCWVWDLSPQSQISLILRFILWMIMIVGKTNSTSATQIQPSPRSKGRRWITSRETTGLSAIIHSKIQGEWRCEASQIFRPFQISSKPKKTSKPSPVVNKMISKTDPNTMKIYEIHPKRDVCLKKSPQNRHEKKRGAVDFWSWPLPSPSQNPWRDRLSPSAPTRTGLSLGKICFCWGKKLRTLNETLGEP